MIAMNSIPLSIIVVLYTAGNLPGENRDTKLVKPVYTSWHRTFERESINDHVRLCVYSNDQEVEFSVLTTTLARMHAACNS